MKAHLAALFALLALLSLAGCGYALVTGNDGRLWLAALGLAGIGFAGSERDAGLPLPMGSGDKVATKWRQTMN
jgi:hypothetical protein